MKYVCEWLGVSGGPVVAGLSASTAVARQLEERLNAEVETATGRSR